MNLFVCSTREILIQISEDGKPADSLKPGQKLQKWFYWYERQIYSAWSQRLQQTSTCFFRRTMELSSFSFCHSSSTPTSIKNDTRLCLPHIPCPPSIYSQDVTVQTISHIIPTLKLSLKLRPHSKTSVTVIFAKTFAVFAGNERLCKAGKALALLLLCLCSPTS